MEGQETLEGLELNGMHMLQVMVVVNIRQKHEYHEEKSRSTIRC